MPDATAVETPIQISGKPATHKPVEQPKQPLGPAEIKMVQVIDSLGDGHAPDPDKSLQAILEMPTHQSQVLPSDVHKPGIILPAIEQTQTQKTVVDTQKAAPVATEQLYSTEQQTSSKELFPPATPAEQIKSCYQSLNNVVRDYEDQQLDFNDQEIAAISLYQDLLRKIVADPTFSTDQAIAEKAIRTTVALLDSSVVDEIELSGRDSMLGKSQYFREIGYWESPEKDFTILDKATPRILFTVKDEQQRTIDHLKETAKVATVSSAEDFAKIKSQKPDIILFSQSMSMEDADKMIQSAQKLFPSTPIAVPFKIDDNLGGLLVDNTGNLKYDKLRRVFYPRSEVPRQEVWMGFLGRGKALFRSNGENDLMEDIEGDNSSQQPDQLLQELDSYWKGVDFKKDERSYGYLRRKTGVWLRASQEKVGQFYNRHVEHFRRVIADRLHSAYGEAEVILTRSGVSANEATVRAIAHHSGTSKEDRPSLYIMNGFYFENILDVNKDFKMTQDADQAKVFFVNQEPSDPFGSLPFPEPYSSQRDALLKNIIARSKQDPNNKYYIMYDKTHDLLKQTFTNDDQIPANLTVVETGSLTKHQRGGRNYFFGAISAWGDQKFKQQLWHSLSETRGNLTPLGTIHIPRLTKEEILKRNVEFAAKTRAVADEVEKVQTDVGIPEEFRWKFQPQTYFGWFKPPTEAILKQIMASTNPATKQQMEKNLKKHFQYYFETELGFDPSLRNEFVDAVGLDTPTIVNADSFGLDKTVLTGFEMDPTREYYKMIGKNIDRAYKEFGVSRIAPGAKTSEEELRIYTDKLMDRVTEKMKRFLRLHQIFPKTA